MGVKIYAFRQIAADKYDPPQGIVFTDGGLVGLFREIDELCNPHELEFLELKKSGFVHHKFFADDNNLNVSEAILDVLPCKDEEGEVWPGRPWRKFVEMIGKRTFEQWVIDVDYYGHRAIGLEQPAAG
jgi:hypothetical protein